MQKHHHHHHHVHKPKPGTLIKNLKPQNALKASKTIVLAKKNKLQDSLRKGKYEKNFDSEDNNNSNNPTLTPSTVLERPDEEPEDEEDEEDSIGSASDLRDVNELSDGDGEEAVSESEIESLDVPSMYTCGSSVYHAECESMTASNTFETRRRKRNVRETGIKSEEEEEDDDDGVAKKGGDKPLLEEFESDGSPQLWDTTWDAAEGTKDVFAMAPFQRPPEDGTKKKSKMKSNDLVTFSPEKLKLDLLTFSESDSQHDENKMPGKNFCKSPNLIILSESDSDLKKPQESEETQTLLANESEQEVNPHLIKDVTVTERLHLVREKLKPLEKLDETEHFETQVTPTNTTIATATTPSTNNHNNQLEHSSFYANNSKSNLFSGNDEDDGNNFPVNLQGFSPNSFPNDKTPEYSATTDRDIFGFTPFYVLPSNRNPFEGDDFKPAMYETNNESNVISYGKGDEGQQFLSGYNTLSGNDRYPSPVYNNKASSSPPPPPPPSSQKIYETGYGKMVNEKESKVHFSLSDKILGFKSEKKIYYDSLKHEEKVRKKLEDKYERKSKNCDKPEKEKHKKHNKNDKKIERGFSNMSFEDCCLSGEDNNAEDICAVDGRIKNFKSVRGRSNPFA